MHAFSLLALAASAMLVSAAPWEQPSQPQPWQPSPPQQQQPPQGGSSGNQQQCGQNQQQACCDSEDNAPALGSSCSLSLLSDILGGGTCSGSVQCCQLNEDDSISLVDLCVPIQL
ncbi:hypothetical protein BDY17DRAFT_309121 [Neohortaea acidophila]|uniref:Hydrophobin n=1 Tax=Neohortaea acidophila TaxID=245834 RepID=A0A6A6Q1F9_9PEZI|nr:uncharacterized protein BDY17DRAFT_309121 [Neohortaea acidophila]KAF2485826.1 hypothetical protein BDY17DRAFT_309121 [Neohortaea acidophila]